MRGQNLKFLVGVLVVLGIIAAILKTWFVDIVVIGHDGMAPTVVAGDTVILWRDTVYEHGTIVLCHHPTDDTRFVMGRIVGRNGADITVDRGRLRIEGTFPAIEWRGTVQFDDHTDHVQVATQWGYEQLGNDFHLVFMRVGRELRLRPVADYDGLYLLNDNRTYSGEDSREFGPVPESRCIGRILLRVGMSDRTPPEIANRQYQILR